MWRLRRQQSASQTEKESLNRHTEDRTPSVLKYCMYVVVNRLIRWFGPIMVTTAKTNYLEDYKVSYI